MTMPIWHTLSAEDAAAVLQTDILQGLSTAEAAERIARHGPNALPQAKPGSVIALIARQFASLMVGLLVAAAGVALALGDWVEAVAILVVILLNAVIGFATEWKAASALAALRGQAVTTAQVLRDGAAHEIATQDLVPGDVVVLAAGDRVPADGRLIRDVQLQLDESALTGESLPVTKSAAVLVDAQALPGDRTNMVHMGTAVTDGRGRCIITGTGAETEMGRIGALIDGVAAHGTPLEAKLAELSRALLVIVLALCAVITLLGWLRGNELLFMVEVGISLAIAAVPEGLLAVTTMTLAVGMQRMARMGALVRSLPAVEALGSTTVICTDKTGTLTRNEMTVRAYALGALRVDVTGTGYTAKGSFQIDGRDIDPARLGLALRIGALCNDATVDRSGDAVSILGDPTEAALIIAAGKAGLDRDTLHTDYPRIREMPFNSESRLMVTVHTAPNGGTVAYVKGAPGMVLAASATVMGDRGEIPMTDEALQQARAANESLAAGALRVLALAHRALPDGFEDADLTRGLTFVGLVGMIDPLRDEVGATIARCIEAGIRVVMITGDQQATAAEIGRQLGLDTDRQGRPLLAVHGSALADLDDAGWRKIAGGTSVFARVSPEHKLKIVEALQHSGQVVAMTGDGVNDAPALRQADIGIAMGIRGTEVAKEASAMVITDDNFATIVSAVEQGRVIVHNILRFIHYLFSCNFAEIITVGAAIMIGWPLPLGVMQILWLNLVTDIFPAMALALEPSAPDVMRRPPRDPAEPLMTRAFGWLIVWQGCLLAGCTLAAFAIGMRWYGVEGEGLRHAVTIAFMTLAMAQMFHAFSARSRSRSALSSRLFTNGWLWGATGVCLALQIAAVEVPLLREVLRTVALSWADWGVVAAGALTPVMVVELVKLVTGWRSRANPSPVMRFGSGPKAASPARLP
jgi:P-type Ca2+ transporter type 2C